MLPPAHGWKNRSMTQPASAVVVGVSKDSTHRFSKVPGEEIELVAGHGVVGDAHAGTTVKHRSRVAKDPTTPNLRQVHLIHREFLELAREHGYELGPGDLGENVLTSGVDLLDLPRGTLLRLGADAVVRGTGLRNPCQQINDFRAGLLKLAVTRDEVGQIVRRTGVMSVGEVGGVVRAGDPVTVALPELPHEPLEPV